VVGITAEKKYLRDFPQLMSEWDWEENNKLFLDPNILTHGTSKRAHWICPKGHKYLANISNRTISGSGCPYCAGLLPVKGETDLATTHPQLIKEWDWEENNKLSLNPDLLSHGSTKHVHWICDKGHKYVARIDHRTVMGSACPYCARKLPIKGETDLATTHPHLLEEWDYENNEHLPEEYLEGSNKSVNWICKDCGHHWKTKIIGRTLKNSGCPICMKIQRGKTRTQNTIERRGSLEEEFPEIAKEWDFEKNAPLLPSQVHKSSREIVWWKGVCGHSWEAAVYNRVSGAGCHICAGKEVLAGFNDLASKFPDISKQWHPKNFPLTPDKITAHNDKKVWWLCPDCGEEYFTSIYSRTSLGTGCPICANRIVIKGMNDLASIHPEIAAEWNYDKNTSLLPTDVAPGSNKKVWWVCEKGHEWKAMVASRIRGRGCPECNKEHSTSFPEQALFLYLSKVTKAVNRYIIEGREIDIFLPELNIGIEYNGMYYHKNRKLQDEEKYSFFRNRGIRMIAIYESDKMLFEGDTIFYQYVNSDYTNLDCVIHRLTEICGLAAVDVDIKRDRMLILEQYAMHEKANSLAAKYPWLIDEWDQEKNGKLTPWHISYGSTKRINWKCKVCGYQWDAVANSRKRNGCPRCAGQIVTKGYNDLASQNPELVKEWNYGKNGGLLPEIITCVSNKKVWWICEKGHEWEATVASRTRGRGCPTCAKVKSALNRNRTLLLKKGSLAEKHPELIKEWNYSKNTDISPTDVTAGSNKKVWWICEKGHEWEAAIKSRMNGTGCPNCYKLKK